MTGRLSVGCAYITLNHAELLIQLEKNLEYGLFAAYLVRTSDTLRTQQQIVQSKFFTYSIIPKFHKRGFHVPISRT